jgi:hypothetical protein
MPEPPPPAVPIAASAPGTSSSAMVRPTSSIGRNAPEATAPSMSGYSCAAMPWLPRISSSPAMTASMGMAAVAASPSMRPICT